MPEIMEGFREEGLALGKEEGNAELLQEKAIEDARKMREHGIEWAIVKDVTGIRPEVLG